MFDRTDQYVQTLVSLGITANQFLLCHLLYEDQEEEINAPQRKRAVANIYKYGQKNKWVRREIEDLLSKGYLVDNNSHKSWDKKDPALFSVTPLFVSKVYTSLDKFWEIWEIYPKTIPSFDGRGSIKLKMCDPEELEEKYNAIVKTKSLHKEIKELVLWAIDNNQMNMGIEKFIKSRGWSTLRELKEQYNDDNMRVAR